MSKRIPNSHRTPKGRNTREMKLAAHPAYPFSAVVGQEEMKLALILNAIDPSVGGVLIMGHRGTGKSTVVRALADLLPQMSVVSGCSYRCDPVNEPNLCSDCIEASRSATKLARHKCAVPVVELPLGATEDRVCGTIDIAQALGSGLKRFEPGLLARANRGFLYIDEVNLLEDHLVDLLLDVATTGVNKVERESISVEHPAQFVLIGSGNPEEGELRPQLLDRFGLYVEVKTEDELERRVEIVERCDAFERDRDAFRLAFAGEQEQLRKKITRARRNLGNVKVERRLLKDLAQLCSDLKVYGHRGELTITRSARALAAFEGRKKLTETDVKQVAVMALRHRLCRDALEEAASAERIEQALEKVFAKARGAGGGSGDGDRGGEGNHRSPDVAKMRASASSAEGKVSSVGVNGNAGSDPGAPSGPIPSVEANLPKLQFDKNGPREARQTKSRFQSSRQTSLTKAVYDPERGRYARAVVSSRCGSSRVALDATLRAATILGFQVSRVGKRPGLTPETRLLIPADALRFKLFKRKQGRLFIFAIDLSGSMALNRIAQAKGTMIAMLRQSYVKRDSVAIVGFRGASAELLLPPSRSILRARLVLDSLGVGGRTPLSAGLACALQLAKRVGTKSGEMVLLLFTDGRANVTLSGNGINDRTQRQDTINKEIARLGGQIRKAEVTPIVIDTQNDFSSNGNARFLAETLGAEYKRLPMSQI